MNFMKSMAGMLEVEITSAFPEETLKQAAEAGISIFSARTDQALKCAFRIHRRDYPVLMKICQKRGDSLDVLKRIGVFWSAKRLVSRPILLFGFLLLLILMLLIPTRVLFIQVEGCSAVPQRQILEAAEELGLSFGASRRQIRSEQLKNGLLSKIPELKWAGVNTKGCVAVISVRERTAAQETLEKSGGVGNVVAVRDGIVDSVTVTQGTGMCQPGQAVKQGQVLISGYTDCGRILQAALAKGEVYAKTSRDLTAVSPLTWTGREEEAQTNWDLTIILGKKRINLWKGSGIWDSSCGRISKEIPLTLPGGFRLPVTLVVERVTSYTSFPVQADADDTAEALARFSEAYLCDQMIAGKILSSALDCSQNSEKLTINGRYDCLEMIGREQTERIGEYHGQTSGENG